MRWHEFRPGARFRTAEARLSAGEIRDFARAFDPQPLHLDPSAAGQGVFGGVVASGYHTLALSWRLWVDVGAFGGDGLAGLGLERLRWLRPVRPGDAIWVEAEVLDARASASRPGAGVVRLAMRVHGADDGPVLTYEVAALVAG